MLSDSRDFLVSPPGVRFSFCWSGVDFWHVYDSASAEMLGASPRGVVAFLRKNDDADRLKPGDPRFPLSLRLRGLSARSPLLLLMLAEVGLLGARVMFSVLAFFFLSQGFAPSSGASPEAVEVLVLAPSMPGVAVAQSVAVTGEAELDV